jgi:hypothetical protein
VLDGTSLQPAVKSSGLDPALDVLFYTLQDILLVMWCAQPSQGNRGSTCRGRRVVLNRVILVQVKPSVSPLRCEEVRALIWFVSAPEHRAVFLTLMVSSFLLAQREWPYAYAPKSQRTGFRNGQTGPCDHSFLAGPAQVVHTSTRRGS